MKAIIFILLLAFLAQNAAFSQCASQFVSGTAALVEACNPSGSTTYAITTSTVNDSTFTILGLWLEPQFLCTAHVDCGTMTFTIDSTAFPNIQFHLRGQGAIAGNMVSINYSVGQIGSSNVVDQCVGNYGVQGVTIDPSHHPQLNLWPNPASEHIQVSLSGAQISVLSIVDIKGQVLTRLHPDGEVEIPLTGLPAGNYFVLAQTDDGQLLSRRFTKQ